jgi:hypothetical protein
LGVLSKADDYPIHQTPEPIAYAGSDRNFYDRYFFNGMSAEGDMFFGAALGVYPQLNIMDAAFGVRFGDVQYNLHASRHLEMERMDTQVGPIRVEVIEPLQRLRIVVDDNEHGIGADLRFEGRMAPIEEPRSVRRHGPRTIMDFTRMTQFGRYTGWIQAGGRKIDVEPRSVSGVRDRSWGVRAIGERDPQALAPPPTPQFHWFWAPLQFEDCALLFFINEDKDGAAWHRAAALCHDDGRIERFEAGLIEPTYHSGTRWPSQAAIILPAGARGVYRVELQPNRKFFMTGIGYMNPDWSHGMNKGALAVGYDEIRETEASRYAPPHLHVEAFAHATMTTPEGRVLRGLGTLESLSMGPHARHGFTAFCDGA